MTPAYIGEEIIEQSLVSLPDLRTQKNSLLPIFRLPPETLENIFIHGAHDYYELERGGGRVPHWVNVSYVCRYWRDVALNCAALWTYHFTVSLRWTEELLVRSKQASLKIHIGFGQVTRGGCWWSLLVEKVLNHAERIQELCLHFPDEILSRRVSLHAPRLQILDISLSTSPSPIEFEDAPPLHTLKLAFSSLPWHSTFNLSRITTLFLCRIPFRYQQDIMEFLTTLSGMQALTVLRLVYALPSARGYFSSGALNVSLNVRLPCLASLYVIALLSTTVALLSCIDIPLKTCISLEIVPEYGTSIDDYDRIPSVLAQRFKQSEDLSSSSPTIHSLTIQYSLTCFTITTSDPYRGHVIPFVIHVAMRQSMAANNMDRIIGDICCSIPLTGVETLYVIGPPFSPDFWGKMLGHLDGLRCMKLGDGYMPDLVSLLTLPANEPLEDVRGDVTGDREAAQHRTFIPALEELELYHIRFAYMGCLSGNVFSQRSSLLDALSTRKALRLTMTKCEDVLVGCKCELCWNDASE